MRQRQRVLVLAAMAILGVAAARIATPSTAAHVRYTYAACGVERWSVKTLQDRPRLVPIRRTSIAWLVTRPAPDGLPAARLPLERRIFQVVGAVTLVRPRGRQRPPPRARRRRPTHDRRGAVTRLHRPRDAAAAQANEAGAAARPALRQGAGHRRRVLRHEPRPDRRRAERDRAPPGAGLPLSGLVGERDHRADGDESVGRERMHRLGVEVRERPR